MMRAYWKMVWILFGIFVVVNLAYLHRVPGLMGDEGSEGENVYQLLRSEKIVVQGERSYIGPLIDYLRVPFIATFGYTPLGLRLTIVLISCGTFWLAAGVLKRLFGETPAVFALALGFFSPIYLTQERLGWAITLMPFFFFLTLYFLTHTFRHTQTKALLAGLAAGLGLSNYILFFPTLAAIVAAWLLYVLMQSMKKGVKWLGLSVVEAWPSLIGFWAGFATQFVILLLFREDQGDLPAVAQLFSSRLADLPQLMPLLVSGSSYVASYTGIEFSQQSIWVITAGIIILGLIAPIFSRQRKIALLWLLGMAFHLTVLTYMIDRFTLRYFILFVFAAWILAGVGLGTLLESLASSLPKFDRPTRPRGGQNLDGCAR